MYSNAAGSAVVMVGTVGVGTTKPKSGPIALKVADLIKCSVSEALFQTITADSPPTFTEPPWGARDMQAKQADAVKNVIRKLPQMAVIKCVERFMCPLYLIAPTSMDREFLP